MICISIGAVGCNNQSDQVSETNDFEENCIIVSSEAEIQNEKVVSEESTQDLVAPETTWDVIYEDTFDFPVYYSGFYNTDYGITVGYGGEIHYTTDGGVSWPKATNNSACRYGLDIVSENTSYTCGNMGQVTKSTDGGLNFTRVDNFGGSTPYQCKMLSFCDETNGLIASSTRMAITNDGATSWKQLTAPVECISVYMDTPETFYCIGKDFYFYKTVDGGTTWEKTQLNLPEKDDYYNDSLNVALHADGEQSYTIYCIKKSDKTIHSYSTEDQWKTLTENPMPEVEMFASLYLNNSGDILTLYDSLSSEITVLKNTQ